MACENLSKLMSHAVRLPVHSSAMVATDPRIGVSVVRIVTQASVESYSYLLSSEAV